MPQTHAALVAVESPIARDPRVRRQIAWLRDAGFVVDSLALGAAPPEPVRDHFELGPAPSSDPVGTLRRHLLSSRRRAFRELTLSRFPAEVRRRVHDGAYDLIVLNDRHFAPWVDDPRDFPRGSDGRRIHLDLHEYFVPSLPASSAWNLVTRGYYAWARRQIAHEAFTSRSTVSSGIARLYEHELGVAPLAIVRSSPPFAEFEPSPVDASRIRLIHHGSAHWNRGLGEIVDAMRMLDERFEMTFMLLGDPSVEAELARRTADLGDRVRVVPPVETTRITETIREYDLEIMFFPPRTRNLELALPNKLFEAVQARLGLVIGRSPMMQEIVDRYGNGLVVEGWSAADLAEVLRSLTPERVAAMKAASSTAALELNAETERVAFLASALGTTEAGR
ncbi:glycosyltransferase [Microcella alkalica]|uniref:glycosyltransferase n=1 Tax=Microcella alkalica TaxID=355930 RepID=UPI00145EE821|nr:glycosyltransferase [Microcella alkalica]